MSSKREEDDDAVLNELAALVRTQEETMAIEPSTHRDGDPFGPLSEAEQDALTASLLARLEKEPTETGDKPLAKVVTMRPARRAASKSWPLWATALSVAAAALLMFWPKPDLSDLPAYALVLPSPDASHRDANGPNALPEGKVPSYLLGRELEILLRPETRIEGAVDAFAFLERDGGKLSALAVRPASVSGGGVVFRIPTGSGTALPAPGSVRLHFVLTSAGKSAGAYTSLADIPRRAQHLIFRLTLRPDTSIAP